MRNRYPNLFIIGAPKCGTSTIYEWLAGHPEIQFSSKKEPNYFNTDHLDNFRPSLDQYESLFTGGIGGYKYAVEASAWYLYSEVAVPEIVKVRPDARFIVCLRSPADMVFSLHSQNLFAGEEVVSDLRQAWDMQSLRRSGASVPPHSEMKRLMYEDVCRLGTQLERLYRTVDPESVQLVFLDDLRTDGEAAFSRLLHGLGLAPYRPSFAVVNRAKRRRSDIVRQLALRLARFKEATGIRRSFGILPAIDRWNSVLRPWDRNEAFRQHLQILFESEVALLEQLTGRDLGAWKHPGRPGLADRPGRNAASTRGAGHR